MKPKNQIVITGYGIVSAMGLDKEENRLNVFAGKQGISNCEFEYKDGVFASPSGVITRELPEHPFYEKYNIYPDRASNLALIAADECIKQSNIDFNTINPLRVGIVVGTSLGGMRSADVFHKQWIEQGIEKTDSNLLKQYPLHAVADILAKEYGFNGSKIIISTACSSGANAIGLGYDLLKRGMYDLVLAGGVDPISRFSFAGFTSLKAIDSKPCRPFSGSTGINLGEGAAFFILESDEYAQKRKASVIAEVRGYGITADAYHPTAPDLSGNGAFRSMTAAKENGICETGDITYINGHGTGTLANDSAEKKAWRAFVRENTDIPLMSNKAALGHCMGAAGAVEIAISVMSIENDQIPPTVNFNTQEAKDIDEINFVPNKAIPCEVNNVISNSYAFGGNNCSVLLSKYIKRTPVQNEECDIVITGIGCIGSGGGTAEELFKTFEDGSNWIEEIDVQNNDFNTKYVGKMPEVDYKKYIKGSTLRRMDTVTKMAMTSGKQALNNSGLKVTPQNCTRIGVLYGTGTGPLETIENVSRKMITGGINSIDPNNFPNTVLNAAAGNFSIANMLKGPTSTISAGSVSGLNAFIYASELLKNNQADAVIVLSSDEWNEALQIGNERLGLLTKNGKLPFDKDASGMILSPGSTAFVLERKDYALQRGAKILAQVYGYSMTSDNADLCSFDAEGTQWIEGVELARKMADDIHIDYYASTAYGIPMVDRKEAELMAKSLDNNTIIRSIPRLIGATSGSLGSYGLLSCIYALEKNTVPNQGNVDGLSEEYDSLLNRTQNTGTIDCAAVSAASFGGSYTTVIIGKVL
ncbi:beta-ketoacyl-[acyl-carrier-protein] synthase family protein [Clostridium sp. BNL1100]|uniref:beta-ketoacyl-[acyl-carrier-protein] synthase family protein n=1 Tax=Clostridium sp. BNL1100 TaxID=755731 RepID=UPI00024A7CFE|nr:beta-ketoacyl-[acyl-carrier-protein] synthase family protein [Clostridium sp. BNL1100]AEY67076.1 3-oxoacyl-(acyl-carrier-protein) synthase [Clostridium sp. BNL1100]